MIKKEYKAYTLSNFRKIPQITALSEEDKEAIEIVGRILPFKTNNYILDELINWDDVRNDPIYTITFPKKEMLQENYYKSIYSLVMKPSDEEKINSEVYKIRLNLNPNPSRQRNNIPRMDSKILDGIQHKYKETVLYFPSQGQTCHAYCTFCFRWAQFSNINEFKFAMKDIDILLKYLKSHKDVTDILFTGGDPLIMNSKYLAQYIEPLLNKELDHIRTIRIGTKSLSYWPYRFINDKDSDNLMFLFEKIKNKGKNIAIQAHFNHPIELSTDAVKHAIQRINSTGARIRTQSPLLRNINDQPDLWADMWRKQVDLDCIPYYMFVARDTGSRIFFEVPLEECWQIFRKAYSQVSGICRTVKGPSMSTDFGKIEILGVTSISQKKVFVLRFIQCKNPDWVDIPFYAEYDPRVTWFDQLKPAFDEKKFFHGY